MMMLCYKDDNKEGECKNWYENGQLQFQGYLVRVQIWLEHVAASASATALRGVGREGDPDDVVRVRVRVRVSKTIYNITPNVIQHTTCL